MNDDKLGSHDVTDEDPSYAGARSAEVRKAILANSYQDSWGLGAAAMLVYKVTLSSLTGGL